MTTKQALELVWSQRVVEKFDESRIPYSYFYIVTKGCTSHMAYIAIKAHFNEIEGEIEIFWLGAELEISRLSRL